MKKKLFYYMFKPLLILNICDSVKNTNLDLDLDLVDKRYFQPNNSGGESEKDQRMISF